MYKAKASKIFSIIVGILLILLAALCATGIIAIVISGFKVSNVAEILVLIIKIVGIIAFLILFIIFLIAGIKSLKLGIKLARDNEDFELEDRKKVLKNTYITYLVITILLIGFLVYMIITKFEIWAYILTGVFILFSILGFILVRLDYKKISKVVLDDTKDDNTDNNLEESNDNEELDLDTLNLDNNDLNNDEDIVASKVLEDESIDEVDDLDSLEESETIEEVKEDKKADETVVDENLEDESIEEETNEEENHSNDLDDLVKMMKELEEDIDKFSKSGSETPDLDNKDLDKKETND